ncbi:hypothetical protein [Paracoccus siganidrum]|uniref:hypothetical protein n=1 Tax=Paracoccus siganidrum TaxID=1276757 RepID=UPI001FD130E2|nr:hypothetical protein [Paracoccus siganidrum]
MPWAGSARLVSGIAATVETTAKIRKNLRLIALLLGILKIRIARCLVVLHFAAISTG